jgi:hypothetical protein
MNDQAPQDHPNGPLYCDLMEYIKWRVESVLKTIHLVRTKQHYLDDRLAAEFCLLQLRMCCELLAIGCIAIHTDVPQTARLQKMWNADSIMSAFEKLKPEFFPEGTRDERQEGGVIQQHAVDGAMTKDEFLKAYNLFGGMLHTGNFQRYKTGSVETYDFSIIEQFLEKLTKLLSAHVYFLEQNKAMVRVIMHNVKDGRVYYNYLVGEKIADSDSSKEGTGKPTNLPGQPAR